MVKGMKPSVSLWFRGYRNEFSARRHPPRSVSEPLRLRAFDVEPFLKGQASYGRRPTVTHPTRLTDVLVVGLLAVALNCKPAPEKSGDITPSTRNIPPTERVAENAPADLGGTSWRLVKFQSSDETILRPDDPAKYTIAPMPGPK